MGRLLHWLFLAGVLAAAAPTAAREWTDASGAYKVEAELVAVAGDVVRLRTADGAVIQVPLDRLSEVDRRYLRAAGARAKREDGREAKAKLTEGAGGVEAGRGRPVQAIFEKTPLHEAVLILEQAAGIPIRLDRRALDDVGISTSLPVSLDQQQGDLAVALDALLLPNQRRLDWMVRDGVVWITSTEETEASSEPRVYKLRRPQAFDALIADIAKNVEPRSWDSVGGPGTIRALPPDLLVIAQSYRRQREIARRYGEAIEMVPHVSPAPIPVAISRKLAGALIAPSQSDFVERSLADVVADLRKECGEQIAVDEPSLAKVGIGMDAPVTARLSGIPLGSGLSLLSSDLGLTWIATQQGIRITLPEVAEAELEAVRYPVGPLLGAAPPDRLLDAITSTVAPQTWNHVGGPGAIAWGAGGALEVRQTFHVHCILAQLLEDIRRARTR